MLTGTAHNELNMARRNNNNHKDMGNYLMGGGKRVELEHESDRFTARQTDTQQLERLRSVPGVRSVLPATREVSRVLTTMNERDAATNTLRSSALNTVVHHAYRPRDGEGTVFYITDRVILGLKKSATDSDADTQLEK